MLRIALIAAGTLAFVTLYLFREGGRAPYALNRLAGPESRTGDASAFSSGRTSNFIALDTPLDSLPFSGSSLRHMVMVAGHAVLKPFSPSKNPAQDSEHVKNMTSWVTKAYQNADDVRLYLEHIRIGADLAARDPSALLVFSGGQTDKDSKWSEGMSYWHAARALNLFDSQRTKTSRGSIPLDYRAVVEGNARDSYENLLYSLCRFRALTGNYPEKVTVVSYPYKHVRFVHFHAASMRYPIEDFHFLALSSAKKGTRLEEFGGAEDTHAEHHKSVDRKGSDGPSIAAELYRSQLALVGDVEKARISKKDDELASIPDHELEHSLKSFLRDPHGCFPPLSDKKLARDPWKVGPASADTCPEMRGLMDACVPGVRKGIVSGGKDGIRRMWTGPVPWAPRRA